MSLSENKNWMEYLEAEDLTFVKRLLLASGSLKRLAADYGVSYPTVRLRLDRLIAKVQVIEDQRIQDPFERLLRSKLAEGKLDPDTMRALLEAHRAPTGGE